MDVKSSERSARLAIPFMYRMYGLKVESQIPLPLPPAGDLMAGDRDWTIRLGRASDEDMEPRGSLVAGLRCYEPCHNGDWVMRVYRAPDGTWFWYDAIGTFHVSSDGSSVTVFAMNGAETQSLGVILMGPVATFVLHTLGYPSLHASAVVVEGHAIVFIGPGGQGKTTMAASFLRRGAALLTDDVLPLSLIAHDVHGIPSLPLMKLWRETAEHSLQLSGELPNLTHSYTKKLFVLDNEWKFASTPAPVHAVYVLDRYDPVVAGQTDCTFSRLEGREGLAALLAQTSNRAFLQPHENAILLPLYQRLLSQAAVRVLHFPHGFGNQEAVHAAVIRDLAA